MESRHETNHRHTTIRHLTTIRNHRGRIAGRTRSRRWPPIFAIRTAYGSIGATFRNVHALAMTLELAIILFSIAAMLLLLGSVMANVSLLQRRMDALEQRIAQVLECFEEATTHDA